MRLKSLFIWVILFLVCGKSYGQLISWDFTSANTPNINLPGGIATVSFNTGGANATSGCTGNGFSTDGWNVNEYLQIVAPTTGYEITTLTFNQKCSNTGPLNFKVQYSSTGIAGTFNDLTTFTTTNLGTCVSKSIDFTAINTIDNNANTVIRFVFTGGKADGSAVSGDAGSIGTFRIDDLVINGAVTGITTTGDGAWNSTIADAPWPEGIIPTAAQNVIIAHKVTSEAVTRNSGTITIINTGASLTLSNNYTCDGATTNVNGTFQLDNGGWITGATNFTYGAVGTLKFNGSASYEVGDTAVFWPTTSGPFNVYVLQGGITLNATNRIVAGTFQTTAGVTLVSSILTLDGTVQINTGGFFNQSPIYGSASTLIYNSGGTYDRGNEWQAIGIGTISLTPGYPNNIQLTGNTTLNYNNGTPLAKAIAGSLTIDSGSNFYMDSGGSTSGGALIVAGNVTNNGHFSLGNDVGDDLKIGGDFTNTGVFNGNNRAVFFTKVGTQIVTSVSGITIPYIIFSEGTTVQLATGTNMLISAPNEGNAIIFANLSNVFDINIGNTLTIGTATKTNTISGSGSFKGSTTSNLTLLGTGSIGTLKFTSDLNLGTFTMNRQAATMGCSMGSAVTINTALNLTNGLISLGNFDISLALSATNIGSANAFVISDPDVGTGKLSKRVDFLGAYTLHIGENTTPSNPQYTPATINFSSIVSFSPNAFYGVQVKDAVHPNIDSPTDYLTKYWIITSSGTFDTPVYSFTGLYNSGAEDVNGTESNCISAKWDGTKWINGTAIGEGTLTITGLTKMATSTTNEISAGYRNREINIKGLTGGINTILSGSTTANGLNNNLFATTSIGSSTTKNYEIQNLGISALNLTGTPIVNIDGANPNDFTVTTDPLTTVVGGSSTSFAITFSPTFGGIRTAIVSITNNDNDENPYTFLIQGTGVCTNTAINTITPTSGPIGTEVIINATANNLTGATATFNGLAATSITYVSPTQIKVVAPSGATTGNLITTNVTGCQTSNYFSVIDNQIASCQGNSTPRTTLFISEITDHGSGSHTYVEIFNATGATVNLLNYTVRIHNNGALSATNTITLPSYNLTNNTAYLIAFGGTDATSNPGGVIPNLTNVSNGINDNDNIRLYNSAGTWIDLWGDTDDVSFTVALKDYAYRRKNIGITAPSTIWNPNEWNFLSPVDYSNIGLYDFSTGTPPTVTTQPSYTPTCKSTTLTVSGTEGYQGENTLTYKWLYSAPSNTGWTEITDGTNYSGSSTATLSIANISTIIDYQYYCQIKENTNTCYTASNAVKIIDSSITWNGTYWIDINNVITTPSLSKLAIINADYNTNSKGSFEACSVIVNSLSSLTITANEYIKIQNDLTNNGTLNIENDGSLVQINDSGINTGTITYERKTPPVFRTDYTYWASPVAGYTLGGVSQNLTLSDKYYSYDSTIEDWKQESVSTTMMGGIGYIIRGPETPFQNPFEAFFIGVPNNGLFSLSQIIADKSYLLGNPYPSALDANTFLAANSNVLDGTLYFWTHKTPLNLAAIISNPGLGWTYTYSLNDYAAYNPVGGVGINDVPFQTGGSPAPSGSSKPTGKIASGQGFFASSKTVISDTDIIFNNSMRVGVNEIIGENTQFFKPRNSKEKTTYAIEKHRIWLNLTNKKGTFKQTLIGYITDATNEYDSRFDGVSFDGDEFVDFYSLNQDKNLVIQGRALSFNENDQVPLGYRTTIEGDFTINIDQVDGVLTNQAVFIEDKLTNTVFDLKSGNYTFNTVAGTFNDRFILRYTNKILEIANLETLENQVLISNKNKQINVNSTIETIDKVTVYDMLGRQLFKKEKINSHKLLIPNLYSGHQNILVKVTLLNGCYTIKKVVF